MFDVPFLELPYSIWYGDWMEKAYNIANGGWVQIWLLDITTFIQCKIKKEI